MMSSILPAQSPRAFWLWLEHRFELRRQGETSGNLSSMEGLRGFAVFLIFLVHFVTLAQPWLNRYPAVLSFANGVHTIGNAGVDLFFVLSGYLIYGSLMAKQQPVFIFLLRRIRRIYPAFVTVLAIYLLLSFAFPSESKIPRDLVEAVIYIAQNLLLLPGMFPIEAMISVAWSLSYEAFYYLTIPFVINALRLRRRSRQFRRCFFVALSLALLLYCAAFGGHPRLAMFLCGILLYEASAVETGIADRGSEAMGLLALAAGLLLMLLPLQPLGAAGSAIKVTILYLSFFSAVRIIFGAADLSIAKAFSWTAIRWLGNMSYSYYLMHGLALKGAFLLLGKLFEPNLSEPWHLVLMLPSMFVITLIPSGVLFLLVERPFSLRPAVIRQG